MASLIGHALGALTVWEAGKRLPGEWTPHPLRWLLVPVALAIVPDLDVVVSTAHRGPSHSLLFAAAFASIAGAAVRLLRRDVRTGRLLLLLLACGLVHPLLDFLMGCGPPVPFFWPFCDRGFLSPVQLIPTAYYSRSPIGLIGVVLSPRTWAGIGLELLSLGTLLLMARTRRTAAALAFLAASLAGFALTFLLYR